MIRSRRIGLVHTLLALFAIAVIVQAGRVQLLQKRAWGERAAQQQLTERQVPAPRGAILDASGIALAQSREMVQLAVAPREVREPRRLRQALTKAGVDRQWVSRALDRNRAWVTLPGRYLAIDVAGVTSLRGVHATATTLRTYAMSDGTRRIVGRVDANGTPLDGVELALDSVLRGTPGSATLVRDVRGRAYESPTTPGVAPTAGSTVELTIHTELQEIVERALNEAVSTMDADGGDIVILDPFDGEVLAMASNRRDPRATAAGALTDPFEPGSTMKPFIAAGLLARGLAKETDSVDTGDGVLDLNGRQIHDEHMVGRASLADVLRWSSNVGIVKFASRLTPREEFETLRDFGFGAPTGIPYPSESNGILREPRRWSTQSAASLAIGYEVSATPLQLAAAYAALANGGELLEPALIKEIRDADGHVRYRHERRVVRRVVPKDVADRVRTMLLNVVERGTALQADIANYLVAGKTGTPRRTVNGKYATLQYNPNFAGIFPANAPQYVIVVKIANPHGSYFSAATAAPVTKAVLQAAIAARDAALDRGRLASSAVASGPADSSRLVRQSGKTPRDSAPSVRSLTASAETVAQVAEPRPPVDAAAAVPYVVTLPAPSSKTTVALPMRPVPDVAGLTLRDAVRSLHTAGFRVQLARGLAPATSPAAGSLAPAGSLVRLQFDY